MPHLQATKWPVRESATSADCSPVSPSPVPVGCVWKSNLAQVSAGGSLIRLLSQTVAVDRKRSPFSPQKTLSGSGGQAGCIPLFVLVGTSWREETEKERRGRDQSDSSNGVRESSFIFSAHEPDSSTKLYCYRNSWPFFFLCGFQPTFALFLTTRLQACCCSHTTMSLEWLSADSGWTPVRITARLPLDLDWLFTLELQMPAWWWKGFTSDCSSEAHLIPSAWTS